MASNCYGRPALKSRLFQGANPISVALRMKNLGIEHVYQGHENKLSAFNEIIEKTGITPEQAAHVGDDLLDLPIMIRVGFAIAVQRC